jgi:hypothetical protein
MLGAVTKQVEMSSTLVKELLLDACEINGPVPLKLQQSAAAPSSASTEDQAPAQQLDVTAALQSLSEQARAVAALIDTALAT